MKSFGVWIAWLKAVCVVFVGFGAALAFFGQTPVFDVLFNHQINPVFWGTAPLGGQAVAFQKWIYGVLGATCVGLGIMLGFVVEYGLKRKEKWAFVCIARSILSWFALDESISLYFRVWFNAAFNLGLVFAIGVPLICMWRQIFKRPDETADV